MARIIESPGVQITEIDLSLHASLPIGTNILINGFTDQGPSQELLHLSSVAEFEQIYGQPTNAAERYAYHTTKQVLGTPAKVIFNRLPYGIDQGDGYDATLYSVLLYPVYSNINDGISAIKYSEIAGLSGDLIVGKPTQTTITEQEYILWQQGGIAWEDTVALSGDTAIIDPQDAGIVIINKLQTTVNQDFEGYYIGISDNLQSSTTAGARDIEFTSIQNIQSSINNNNGMTSCNGWTDIDPARFDFALSGNITDAPNSISESIESAPSWDFGASDYQDALIIGVYKLARSGYTPEQNALRFNAVEYHIGALGADRKFTEPNGFQEVSFNLETRTNEKSTFLDIMVNPRIAEGRWLSDSGVPNKSVRVNTDDPSGRTNGNVGVNLGIYTEKIAASKDIGDLHRKLELGLRLAEDWERVPLDIVLDGGLTTINATMTVEGKKNDAVPGSGKTEFDDMNPVDITPLEQTEDSDIELGWLDTFSQFDTFCRDARKDCMFVADCYRNILIKGKDFKTLDDKTKNYSQNIYTPLKYLVANTNSSYSAVYAQWVKVYDSMLGDFTWVPYSGFQGAIMARLDSVLHPWSAPAGLENGIVVGSLDVALNTTQKQRDLLYRNNLNAVVAFPNDGVACWGQKTLQKKPSAFDRINVRRLFLVLEKATRDLMKYFVFQPNTTFTRARVVNILTPIFDIAKNNEGVYDYRIICDERNNTPQVIDSNELVVDIYLKPVRTAEFILVNFYATRTDQNFDELI